MIHAGPHGEWICSACGKRVKDPSSSHFEVPVATLSQQKYQRLRIAALAVLVLSLILGLLVFFQFGLTLQENSIRQFELAVLAILGIAAAFVLACTEFALTLKSRR